MLVYFIYEKASGKIVHVHRKVDTQGQSLTCDDEEVKRVLPHQIDVNSIGITSAELPESPRQRMKLSVDTATGTIIMAPVGETGKNLHKE